MRVAVLNFIKKDITITSNLVKTSVSVYWLGPDPVISFLIIWISINLIFILQSMKETFPVMQSFKWNFDLLYSNSMCRHSSIPTYILYIFITSNLIRFYGSSTCSVGRNTAISYSFIIFPAYFWLIVTLRRYFILAALPLKVSTSLSNFANIKIRWVQALYP